MFFHSVNGFQIGLMTVKIKYLLTRPEGFYYQRKIPKDLLKFYPQFPNGKLRASLKTKDIKVAILRLKKLNAKYEADFTSLRLTGDSGRNISAKARALLSTLDISSGQLSNDDEIVSWLAEEKLESYYTKKHGSDYLEARHSTPDDLSLLLDSTDKKLFELAKGTSTNELFFTEARDLYLSYKERGNDQDYIADTNYSCDVFLGLYGDIPINSVTREHANGYLDYLLSVRNNKTTSARRRLDKLNAIFNLVIVSRGLTIINPFKNLPIPRYKSDAETREDFTPSELDLIVRRCKDNPTPALLIIAMLVNTGARISEIAGLRCCDVTIATISYISINAEERSLKNKSSERYIPLVGVSLWAAKAALAASGSKWLFPSYASDSGIKSQTVSASCSKWTKKITNSNKTPHSFRHTLNSKFKELEVFEEIRDAIFGWSSKKHSRHYGKPHSLDVRVKYLEQTKV